MSVLDSLTEFCLSFGPFLVACQSLCSSVIGHGGLCPRFCSVKLAVCDLGFHCSIGLWVRVCKASGARQMRERESEGSHIKRLLSSFLLRACSLDDGRHH